jgi:hypothetical protein
VGVTLAASHQLDGVGGSRVAVYPPRRLAGYIMWTGLAAAASLRIRSAAARAAAVTSRGQLAFPHGSPVFSSPQWKQKYAHPPLPPPSAWGRTAV